MYSKTGKLRLPKIERQQQGNKEDGEQQVEVEQMTPAGFMWDCLRSGAYVLIFLALLVLLVRMARWVLGVVRVVSMVMSGVPCTSAFAGAYPA